MRVLGWRETEAPLADLFDEEFACAQTFARRGARAAEGAFGECLLRLAAEAPRASLAVACAAANCRGRRVVARAAKGALCELRLHARHDVTRAVLVAPASPHAEAEAEARRIAARVRERELATLAARTVMLGAHALRLGAVARLSRVPADSPRLGLAWATLRDACGSAERVSEFVAFPGASRAPGVREALAAPCCVVGGLQVSAAGQPVLPCTERPCRAVVSLSACGVLCVSDYMTETLQVHSIPTGARAVLAGGEDMFGCVCGDELFVGWSGECALRHAPVRDVLAGAIPEARLALPGAYIQHARLDTAPRGWIVLGTRGPTECILVDLCARTARILDVGRVYSLGGFSGIYVPNVVLAARRGAEVHAVDEHGASQRICQVIDDIPLVLPSAAAPGDWVRAAVFDHGGRFTFRGERARLTAPVRPCGCALVRLYRDVFLVLDKASWEWRAVRITVP